MNIRATDHRHHILLATTLLTSFVSWGASNIDSRIAVRGIIVFGDSLSDVGTYKVATGSANNPGRFTINPGTIWVDNIAAFYNLKLSPNRSLTMDKDASGATTAVGTASVLGGNNYAEGGARVSKFPGESGIGNNQLVAPVSQQVTNYLKDHSKFSNHELVVIDGGTNDVYAQFDAVCWSGKDNGPAPTTIQSATTEVANAANELVAQIKRIKASGAQIVLASGAVDWSITPFGQKYLTSSYQSKGCATPVPAAQITNWTNQFNSIVAQGVAQLPGVIFYNASTTLSAIAAAPARYGFTNVTEQACVNQKPSNSAVFCTASTLAAPDAAQSYLFSDAFHPTPHGHKAMSDAALAALSKVARPADPGSL